MATLAKLRNETNQQAVCLYIAPRYFHPDVWNLMGLAENGSCAWLAKRRHSEMQQAYYGSSSRHPITIQSSLRTADTPVFGHIPLKGGLASLSDKEHCCCGRKRTGEPSHQCQNYLHSQNPQCWWIELQRGHLIKQASCRPTMILLRSSVVNLQSARVNLKRKTVW